jgi:hypothetical protein
MNEASERPDNGLKVVILQRKQERFEWQLRAEDASILILKKGYAPTVSQARADGEQEIGSRRVSIHLERETDAWHSVQPSIEHPDHRLAQFGGDRIRHHLTTMNFCRLAPVNRGVPSCLGITVNGHLKITRAYPLLYDFFQFGRGLLLFIHAALPGIVRLNIV